MLASEAPELGEPAPEGVRDPRAVRVNQSETLTWATGKKIHDDALERLRADPDVLWIAPVFRALRAQPGPQSLFAINPTRVCEVKFRVCASGFSPEWRSIEDIGALPRPILDELEHVLKHLPRPGEGTQHPRCISLATDGAVYDPELARCGSCEPERSASLAIELEKQKAEARRACLEAQILELELERRRLLLERGELAPFGK